MLRAWAGLVHIFSLLNTLCKIRESAWCPHPTPIHSFCLQHWGLYFSLHLMHLHWFSECDHLNWCRMILHSLPFLKYLVLQFLKRQKLFLFLCIALSPLLKRHRLFLLKRKSTPTWDNWIQFFSAILQANCWKFSSFIFSLNWAQDSVCSISKKRKWVGNERRKLPVCPCL